MGVYCRSCSQRHPKTTRQPASWARPVRHPAAGRCGRDGGRGRGSCRDWHRDHFLAASVAVGVAIVIAAVAASATASTTAAAAVVVAVVFSRDRCRAHFVAFAVAGCAA